MSNAVEPWQQAPAELTDAEWNAYERKAKVFATSALCPRQFRNKPNDAMAVALTARDLHLPFTLTTLGKFFVVEGKVEPAAQLMVGLMVSRGHEIWDVRLDEEISVVAARRAGSPRAQEFSYSIEQAERAGRLDVWVERKVRREGESYDRTEKVVVESPAGHPVPDAELPDWARKKRDAGHTMRNDAWFRYREDMLKASAVRRACRTVCPDVLLGLASVDLRTDSYAEAEIERDRQVAEEVGVPLADDDDIADAELVDDEPAEPEEAPEPPEPVDDVVDEAWVQRFAIGCREQGWNDDQRHALIQFATRGRVSSTKQVRQSETSAVAAWFAGIVKGDYRWIDTPEGWQIGPRA